MISTKTRIAAIACFGISVFLAAALTARAEDSTVNIKLQDSLTNDSMPKNATMADMKMVLDHPTVHAGKVTLHATNESKTMIHEVIVFRETGGLLPFSDEAGKLVEKQMKSMGEVSDLDPGESKEHTFNLTPGNYLLICNQPQHFKRGMWARLKVVAESVPIANAGAPSALRPATKAVQLPPGEEDEGS